MKTLNEYIIRQRQEVADTNEVVGLLLGLSCLALASRGSQAMTNLTAPFANLFGGWRGGQQETPEQEKERLKKEIQAEKDKKEVEKLKKELEALRNGKDTDKDKDDDSNDGSKKKDNDKKLSDKEFNDSRLIALKIAKDANENEKDPDKKKEVADMIKLQETAMFDKDGNMRKPDEVEVEMKKLLPEGSNLDEWNKKQEESLKKLQTPEMQAQLEKQIKDITPDDMNKIRETSKKNAIDTHKEIEDAKAKGEVPEFLKGACKQMGLPEPTKDNIPSLKKEGEPEPKKEGEPEPKKEEETEEEKLNNDEVEKLQDKYSELDPDSDEAKEIEQKLKDEMARRKEAGKKDVDLIPKNEKDDKGRPVQKTIGPRGGKKFRTQVDGKWGEWQYESLRDYLASIFS